MKLITRHNPSPEEVSSLSKKLFRHNAGIIPGYGYDPVVIEAVSGKGAMAGALAGQTGGDWFCIDSLWVKKDFRHQGIGTALLSKAEDIARGIKCAGLYLYTYTFQAPEFYENAGYKIFGTLEHFCGSHEKLFMKKMLT